MNQSGFALLAVLWLIAVLTGLTVVGISIARLETETTRNRVLLARSEWAREACGEIMQARFADDPAIRQIERVDLGRGTWCRASLDDPSRDSILSARLSKLLDSLPLGPNGLTQGAMVLTLGGGIRGTAIVAHASLVVVPIERRLAVLRRASE